MKARVTTIKTGFHISMNRSFKKASCMGILPAPELVSCLFNHTREKTDGEGHDKVHHANGEGIEESRSATKVSPVNMKSDGPTMSSAVRDKRS
ncbi:uncharacterized protein RCC_05978 [Ramularia collo-cygni]|uniref:Uncharacterized protein n=1 Tax=Ramularia collo-cygni TaxID=112498 RepID=A0A2D3UU87_9PEZI|nr:uncharacterized protein RCC_05978 [Ramularia collo-cygni]CZT20121.1 uncharacterized protein RCC_05978 [Ramularia collo-cygni]